MRLIEILTLIRMDKIEAAAPNELLWGISQHALDGGTGVKYRSVGATQ